MSENRTINLALVGSPNSGKTSLYNSLTGHRQKVGNYAGVTVEQRTGHLSLGDLSIDIVDLPGIYSLSPESPDQKIARAVIMGKQADQTTPDVLLYVIDATKLRESLRFALEIKAIGRPMIVALNMMDMARRDGTEIDVERLSELLGMPVIPTVAVRKNGVQPLLESLATQLPALPVSSLPSPAYQPLCQKSAAALRHKVKAITDEVVLTEGRQNTFSRSVDRVVLNPFAGFIILMALMFFMFQAVFSWAAMPMEMVDNSIVFLQNEAMRLLPDGFLQSMIVDGVLAGVGSVIIFLPQILILFFFIMLLEQSGYMSRAAFLMDNIMNKVGLTGHAFIPLLSSFACAIPGIMSARTIDNDRDRLVTILIAPLMACSARLPVYTLIIAAFIPNTIVGGVFNLQGLVMFGLYIAGIIGALFVAAITHLLSGASRPRWFLMELPRYRRPSIKNVALGLWDRSRVFMQRAGTVIMASTLLLWLLASYPKAPMNADQPDILYSAAGMIGRWMEFIFAPIGFGWEICIALVPGMAAREVAVSALGTVYALQGNEDDVVQSLSSTLQSAWSIPTALAFLAWYVFAPQCISTLAVVRRETNGWFWPTVMFVYLFVMAYIAAGATYHISSIFFAT